MSIRLQAPGHSPSRAQSRAPAPRRRSTHATAGALVPAAARPPTTFTAAEGDLAGQAIETFAAAVGGRRQLLATLAVADHDGASDKVVNCLLDPDYASWSLRRICTYAGITVADLFASYKKALFVQAHVEAAHTITTALPPIVADVMRRALPLAAVCPRCQGTPTTPGTSDCPQCQGTGTVLAEPDLDRQKLALELGRLTQQKGGMVVQQTQIAAAGATLHNHTTGSLEQLQQAVGELLFSPQRQRAAAPARRAAVIDVEAPSGDQPVRDDPSPVPRVPHEEEPLLPFPEDDEDEDEDAPLHA